MRYVDLLLFEWEPVLVAVVVGFLVGIVSGKIVTRVWVSETRTKLEDGIVIVFSGQTVFIALVIAGMFATGGFLLFGLANISFLNLPYLFGVILSSILLVYSKTSRKFGLSAKYFFLLLCIVAITFGTASFGTERIMNNFAGSNAQMDVAIANKDLEYAESLGPNSQDAFYAKYARTHNDFTVCNRVRNRESQKTCFFIGVKNPLYAVEDMTQRCLAHPDMSKELASEVVSECIVKNQGIDRFREGELECEQLFAEHSIEPTDAIRIFNECEVLEDIQVAISTNDFQSCERYKDFERGDLLASLCYSYFPNSLEYVKQCDNARNIKAEWMREQEFSRYQCGSDYDFEVHRTYLDSALGVTENNL